MANAKEMEAYRTIPLTRGMVAIVDAADFEWLNQWKWRAVRVKASGRFYAVRTQSIDGVRSSSISMHRQILGLERGDGLFADHRDPEATLDNRRSNLRAATRAQNCHNSARSRRNKTGFKGVYYDKGADRWRAMIAINGKVKALGRFKSPQEAGLAYSAAASAHRGEFARSI